MKKLFLIALLCLSAVASFSQKRNWYPVDGTNTYTVNITNWGTTYQNGCVEVAFTNSNSGASTININNGTTALGAIPLRVFDGTNWNAVSSGDIKANVRYRICYNNAGSFFEIEPIGTGGGGGGAVSSVFGRTGSVVATTSDYDAIQVDNTPAGNISSTNVQAALNELDSEKGTTTPSSTETFSNKSISFGSNTVTTTKAQLNTAVTDGDPGYIDQRIDQNNAATTSAQLFGVISDEVGTTGGLVRQSYVDDVRKLLPLAKTASFVAQISEAGTYKYEISPAASTTITFPSMAGQSGLQWAFWKNVDTDPVLFDFGGVTANGARYLPDTSFVYVTYSGVCTCFQVAGTNPAASGGGGTWGSITGTLSDQTDLQSALDTKVPTTRTVSTTAPLSGGGDLSTNRTLSISDAAADGSTKGAATFTAADFNASSGNISIDYTNGQAASGSTKGFLTSGDYTTFNGKQAALVSGTNIRTVNGTSLLGSGNVPIAASISFNDQTGTSYTLVLTDADNKCVTMNNSSSNTLTIPTNASVAFPIGTLIQVMQIGTGTTTINGPGVTLRTKTSLVSTGQYWMCVLEKKGTDEWYVQNGDYPVGNAITRTNDTNVTVTLGGSPNASVANPVSFTLGWQGTLSTSRGGNGTSTPEGTFTPTLTNVANVTSTSLGLFRYTRVGNTVHFSGTVTVTPTANTTLTQLGIQLPFASAFTTNDQIAGVGNALGIPGIVIGDATNDRAELNFTSTGTSAVVFRIEATYTVL